MKQRGIIHLLPLFFIIAVLAGVYLVAQGTIKLPSLSLFEKKPKVKLQTKYENPFKKEAQFVNPFDTYKNPFVVKK